MFFEPGRHFLSCLHLKGGKAVFPLGQIIKGNASSWKKSVTGASVQLNRAPWESSAEFGSVWTSSNAANRPGLMAFGVMGDIQGACEDPWCKVRLVQPGLAWRRRDQSISCAAEDFQLVTRPGQARQREQLLCRSPGSRMLLAEEWDQLLCHL